MKIKLFLFSIFISTIGSSLTNLVLAYRFLLKTETGIEYSVVIYGTLAASFFLPPVGKKIDKLESPRFILAMVNILLGICQIILANTYSLALAFFLILIITLLSSIFQSVVFKCLPCALTSEKLIKINSILQEIATIGFVFGANIGTITLLLVS